MKIVGIGDLFIPGNYIEKGFEKLKKTGVELEVLDWQLKGFQELQNINLLIEKKGSEAYEPAEYMLEFVKDADIIISQFFPINSTVINNCNNLRMIGVLRSGYENINVDYATKQGITVINTPGRNADAVADFTMGMLLSECRNIARGHLGLKNGKWIREYPNTDYIPDLVGRTVGIIGLGEIGQRVARRLTGFDVNILGYDPYVNELTDKIKFVSLEELMSKSDFVTIHARLTAQTEHLINEKLLGLMKPTAYLINTSRSGLVDENALYHVLKEKKIMGAALDVFDVEPPGRDYPLVQLENVTITPHMAGGSIDAFLNSPKKLAAQLMRLAKGERIKNIVNKELLENGINVLSEII